MMVEPKRDVTTEVEPLAEFVQATLAALTASAQWKNSEEFKRLQTELSASQQNFGNIMAVLFRDGGQRLAKINDDAQAVGIAQEEWAGVLNTLYNARTENERLQTENARLQKELEDDRAHVEDRVEMLSESRIKCVLEQAAVDGIDGREIHRLQETIKRFQNQDPCGGTPGKPNWRRWSNEDQQFEWRPERWLLPQDKPHNAGPCPGCHDCIGPSWERDVYLKHSIVADIVKLGGKV